MRLSEERLKDSNPRPSAWQAVDLRHLGSRNACKSAFPGAWTARLRSRNCAQIPGGLDNERTMSDADGGRPSDQAASWSSQSPSGFRASAGLQATSATTGLAERFPAHIEGGRFAPLLHRISSDAGARYALTDAWDSSRPGAPMADTWALTLGPKADAWRPAFRA